MKKLLFLMSLGLVSLCASAAAPSATAGVESKAVWQGKQLTQDFQPYWFLSAGVGLSQRLTTESTNVDKGQYWQELLQGEVFSAFTLSGGKQFIPEFGLQFTLNDFPLNKDLNALNLGLDLLFDVKNIFSRKYNSESFFNPVLHIGGGYDYNFYNTETASNIAAGIKDGKGFLFGKGGLQLNFRLTQQISLWADASLYIFPEEFSNKGETSSNKIGNKDGLAAYLAGVTYKFNKKSDTVSRMDKKEIDAVNSEVNDLHKHVNAVNTEVKNLSQEIEDARIAAMAASAKAKAAAKSQQRSSAYSSSQSQDALREGTFRPVFFSAESSVVEDNQLTTLGRVALYLKTNPKAKIQLSGYADRQTGNPQNNLTMSQNRVNAVAEILIKYYGISSTQLLLRSYGDKEQPFLLREMNRSVTFKVVK